MSRETVKRSNLSGQAGYGYCASHSRYFWGFRLYLISTPEGMPVICWRTRRPVNAKSPPLEKDHHLVRAGQVILGDKGFAGRDFERFISDALGAPRQTRPEGRGWVYRVPRLSALSGAAGWHAEVC